MSTLGMNLVLFALVLPHAKSFQALAPFGGSNNVFALRMAKGDSTLIKSINDKQLLRDEKKDAAPDVPKMNDKGRGSNVEEYKNIVTTVLSNFMTKQEEMEGQEDPLALIDFNGPKFSKNIDLETLAAVLDAELYKKEWFVTGKVNPIYFSESFRFEDPDVKLDGIENYARGVCKIFDQKTSRAEIISTKVNPELGPNTITCTWRLSGYANIGPGISIKPYIVYTDFSVNPESGLIDLQEDRFDLPPWDILLSSLFPFLIGKLTAPPAPPVEPRVVEMPKLGGKKKQEKSASPFGGFPDFGKWFGN
mmetsp:Transcript_17154/g.22313  ORF Transcript_17154/g.22313 Transcript_17154/m.22313 type:complete len:306 (-) Transcript_17154:243-1160(-)